MCSYFLVSDPPSSGRWGWGWGRRLQQPFLRPRAGSEAQVVSIFLRSTLLVLRRSFCFSLWPSKPSLLLTPDPFLYPHLATSTCPAHKRQAGGSKGSSRRQGHVQEEPGPSVQVSPLTKQSLPRDKDKKSPKSLKMAKGQCREVFGAI